ncbi:COP9 signalosome complex subunit 7 [Paragonimus westermani]|uniref:COP9 signalosome complex subunit 7 n=1 Tax=Paragonimus westermani TaxID=34504 RepID=A0A5J4NDY4_9TREM|nr:COP9 signalosome complex subunit 7 [Paragonimus westermani]
MTTDKLEALLNQLPENDDNAVAEIIVSATEMPGLFVFGEFLDHPSIQRLTSEPHRKYIDLLNLFCYGSYQLYASDPTKYPPLSAGQIRKLKQLSLIDQAHCQRLIPYDLLFEKLHLTSSRELEDLIIELFYLEALSGKIDQRRALLEVESAIGRDIRVEQISDLNKTLSMWQDKVESILLHTAREIKSANDRRFESELHQKKVLEAATSIKEALRGQLSKLDVDSPRMDVDDHHLIHPDLLADGRVASSRADFPAVDSPGGDKDGRSRMAVFKGLRKSNR